MEHIVFCLIGGALVLLGLKGLLTASKRAPAGSRKYWILVAMGNQVMLIGFWLMAVCGIVPGGQTVENVLMIGSLSSGVIWTHLQVREVESEKKKKADADARERIGNR